MSVCSSCGARIFWANTTTGKAMPIDQTPTDKGNVRIGADGTAEVLGNEAARMAALKDGRQLYLSHFATCPNSRQHRRPR